MCFKFFYVFLRSLVYKLQSSVSYFSWFCRQRGILV